MPDFRKINDSLYVSPQVSVDDMADARANGIAFIINNRPDGEEAGQPSGGVIAEAARSAGMRYAAIPIGHDGFGPGSIAEMRQLLAEADGPVLAFCRSGTRSTFLWALTEADRGAPFDDTHKTAMDAGYDISPLRSAFSR